MKKQYIRQVRKDLHIPRSAKTEVVRDLQEIFASAAEHGESEQQVAERLGTPREFADRTARRAPEAKPADPNRYFSRRGCRRVRALCRRSRAARAARRDRTGGRHDEHPGRRGRI